MFSHDLRIVGARRPASAKENGPNLWLSGPLPSKASEGEPISPTLVVCEGELWHTATS
jgi:hypothetical protein